MLKGHTIGVIGSGNMARALVSGLLRGNYAEKGQIVASDVEKAKVEEFAAEFGIHTTTNNREVLEKADLIVLAVKPQAFDRVIREIAAKVTKKKLIVSMAAGVATLALESRLPKGSRVVRVMPNVAALVDAAVTAIAVGEHASERDLELAAALFNAVGRTVTVEEEQMDAVTGLSGSGPAYIFLIIDSLADAGVKVGLSRDKASVLAAQTVLGAAKLLLETGEHPGKLKDMVTSPGGTAIAGIHTLEQGGLRTTLINAVEAATNRSRELGETFHGKQ